MLINGDADIEEVHDVRVGRHPPGGTRFPQESGLVAFTVQGPILHLDGDLAPD